MTTPRRPRRSRRTADPLQVFLIYLGEIEQSVLNRNWNQLAASLRKRAASHLPREVREELVLLTRSSRSSMRAPVQFLRFQYRMTQLAAAGGPMLTAQTELAFPTEAADAARRPPDPNRRVAARGDDDPDDVELEQA